MIAVKEVNIMAKKTNKNNFDIFQIIFWGVLSIAVIAIIVGVIIFTVNQFREIGNTIEGNPTTTATEESTTTTAEFPTWNGEDPGVALGAVDLTRYTDRLVATPDLNFQIGNETIRIGNDIFLHKLPGMSQGVSLLTSVDAWDDYVDAEGLGRSFTHAGMFAVNCKDDYMIAGTEIGKRYLIVTEDDMFTVKVDREVTDEETHAVSNIKYIYEIEESYVEEEYPKTDGHGNLI